MRKIYRNNTSGASGVTFDKARKLWRIRYTWKGARRSYPHLFKSQDEAVEAARELHERLAAKLKYQRE